MIESDRFRLHHLLLLMAVVLALSSGAVLACEDVTIVPLISRLDFGNLRMPEGARGWLAVDPRGGVATSTGVNFATGRRPFPAEIEIQGTPGQHYLLQLSHGAEATAEHATAALGQLLVAVDGQAVTMRGDTFSVNFPRATQGGRAAARIAIGGDLQIHRFSSPLVVQASISLRCLASEPR